MRCLGAGAAASLSATLFAAAPAARAADTPAASGFYLHSGDRVVMYGDSITDQRLYTVFTEAYVTTRFPTLKIDWTDSGWGGDRVSGGGGGNIDTRLQRDVIPYKPTVVTIMLGMNDAGYRPFDQGLFDTYTQGYQHILDTIQKADPGVRFTLIQPSPFDDVTREPKFPGGYNAVLLRYADSVKTLAQKANATLADANTPIVTTLQRANSLDTEQAQKIIPDRVHPGPAGHLILAEGLLKAWNAPALVSAVSVDAAGSKVSRSDGAAVRNLNVAVNAVSWDAAESALPFPLDPQDPLVALVLKSSDFVNTLDQETLQVTGLPAARYALAIDDKPVATFSKEDLAQGVNLATLDTPMLAQARSVLDLTVQHDNLHATRWRQVQVPLGSDKNPGVQKALLGLMNAYDAEERGIVAQQRAAAQPKPHHFTLTPAP